MLDPLSALSLAAVIVQFVDFGSRILVSGYETYHDQHGTTQERFDLEEVTQDLFKFQNQLATPANAKEKETVDMRVLQQLATKCRDLADDLLRLLDDLKVQESGLLRTWDSFRQACRARAKKGEIARLEKLLKVIGEQVNARLIYMIRYVALAVVSSTKLSLL